MSVTPLGSWLWRAPLSPRRGGANLLHVLTRLVVADTGAVVAERLHDATTPRKRMRGLLGRPPLGARDALLLSPCKQVHTFGMRYPIDVVFLDRDWRVTDVVAAMPPQRVSRINWKAHLAIELAEGTAAQIAVGDRLARDELPL